MAKKIRVGIFGSDHQAHKLMVIQQLFKKLEQLCDAVYVEHDFYYFLTESLHYTPPIDGIIDNSFNFDMALSVGGDGTFLRTARQLYMHEIPILGINTGRLGFLADISGDQINESLDEILCGEYKIEERMLLNIDIEPNLFGHFNFALNEVVISKRDTSSMITIHTYLNDEYLTAYEADGLIIAAPTGSTAYSMSVGGPIILPLCDNILLSPVAPHSLNMRPLVIPGSYKIDLEVESRTESFLVALDGLSESFPIETKLRIKKSAYKTKLIKRLDENFHQTLRKKLMWGAGQRVKLC